MGCFDDPVQGHWQEPSCRTCKVNHTFAWKGPMCRDATIQCPLNGDAASRAYAYGDWPERPEHKRFAIPKAGNGIVVRPDLLGQQNGWLICSGHGACSGGTSGTGECACDRGFASPDCSVPCPGLIHMGGGVFDFCSGHGNCHDGADGNATCTCHGLSYGDDCSKTICAGKECDNGECLDLQSEQHCHGYFTGDTCNVCQDGWLEPNCTQQIRTDRGGREAENKHGPLYFQPCAPMDVALKLESGERASLTKDCSETPIPTTTERGATKESLHKSMGNLYLGVRGEAVTDYELSLVYAPRCSTDCGFHGLCSNVGKAAQAAAGGQEDGQQGRKDCSETPIPTTTERGATKESLHKSMGNLYLGVRGEAVTDYELSLVYAPRCSTDCGFHGLCSNVGKAAQAAAGGQEDGQQGR
eukprot:gene4138-45901_t